VRRVEAANASLLEAAAKQDIDGVSRAIAQGADLRAVDVNNNRTAIYWPLPFEAFVVLYLAALLYTLLLWRLVPPRRKG